MSGTTLDGATAVVTGASRGLGQAITLALVEAGARVVAVARDEANMAETLRLAEPLGGSVTPVACDVSSATSVERMAQAVLRETGRVDILVNNAGVVNESPFLDLAADDITRTFGVNILGPMLVTQALGRAMVAQRSGRVINIGSVDAVVGVPNLVDYCASKGALAQFTRALAVEWARYGVTVNCLCPGYIETDLNSERLRDPAVRTKVLGRVPLRRFARPEEIASWVVFLAEDRSSYATGQVIVVDGGESAR
ncbi:SDR family oxidoreductase [Dactylosporangium sp. NPDC051485]|uniref:SDR family NAD(P)-dependent oxidoreductase n=1 Tax=Dactylosporangium sp. NPDC051485 TaxID=3154846 RepID=UPI0034351243